MVTTNTFAFLYLICLHFCTFVIFACIFRFLHFCKKIIPKEVNIKTCKFGGHIFVWGRGASGKDKNILGWGEETLHGMVISLMLAGTRKAENNQLANFPDLGQFSPGTIAKSNISEWYKPHWGSISRFRKFRIHHLWKVPLSWLVYLQQKLPRIITHQRHVHWPSLHCIALDLCCRAKRQEGLILAKWAVSEAGNSIFLGRCFLSLYN